MKNALKASLVVVPVLIIIGVFSIGTPCSSGWYITGYYTPIESEFSGVLSEVLVDNRTEFFKSDFVEEVKTEGWGKTLDGNYIGWYQNEFHLSDYPLDYEGDKLELKTVAADLSVLSLGSQITIPNLPKPWNSYTYTVSDIGPSITGKHIDVYTGEGMTAKDSTEQITSRDQMVCKID